MKFCEVIPLFIMDHSTSKLAYKVLRNSKVKKKPFPMFCVKGIFKCQECGGRFLLTLRKKDGKKITINKEGYQVLYCCFCGAEHWFETEKE